MTGPRDVRVDVLAVDWSRVRRAAPALGDAALGDLEHEIGFRGARRAREEPPPERVEPMLRGDARLALLRRVFVRRAATVSTLRFEHVTGRLRFAEAAAAEERTYLRKLELDREVVPPMKEEAKALRAEIRRLEDELRARGIDPGRIEPRIEWHSTLAVDDYRLPEYESNESRRAKTLEFFRRLG